MSEDIIFSEKNHIGLITLNRPKALNALTHDMIRALRQHLTYFEGASHIHAIVIQTAPGRAFCAGGDIKALWQQGPEHPEKAMAFFNDEYHLNHQIATLTKPYIALLNGYTFGGGVGISLHSPYAIATENFSFCMPETAIGFFPDIGASYLFQRIPKAWAYYLALTGSRLTAAEAKSIGLIKYNMKADKIEAFLAGLFQADLSEHRHRKMHQLIEMYEDNTLIPTPDHQAEIETCFNQSSFMNIVETLKQQNTPWTEGILKKLYDASPISLGVTFEQMTRTRGRSSLAHCLAMDYTLVYHFITHHDFYEGIRALLIEKDKNPHWELKKFDDLKFETIQSYFTVIPTNIPRLTF